MEIPACRAVDADSARVPEFQRQFLATAGPYHDRGAPGINGDVLEWPARPLLTGFARAVGPDGRRQIGRRSSLLGV